LFCLPEKAKADIGIAMVGIGSDAAIETSNAIIIKDAPSKVSEAIKIKFKKSSGRTSYLPL